MLEIEISVKNWNTFTQKIVHLPALSAGDL